MLRRLLRLSIACHCERAHMSPHIHPQPNGNAKKKQQKHEGITMTLTPHNLRT